MKDRTKIYFTSRTGMPDLQVLRIPTAPAGLQTQGIGGVRRLLGGNGHTGVGGSRAGEAQEDRKAPNRLLPQVPEECASRVLTKVTHSCGYGFHPYTHGLSELLDALRYSGTEVSGDVRISSGPNSSSHPL